MSEPTVPEDFRPAGFSPGFLDHGGPYCLRSEGARTLIGLRIAPHHINYHDVAHGGVFATMADVALSYQVYSSAKPPLPTVSLALTTQFLAPARLGDWLVADAAIDRLGGRTAHVSGRICRGGEVLATMTGVYAVTRPSKS